MTEPLADRRIPAGDDYLSREELDAITPEGLIERTRALKPLVAERAASAERQRRPDDEVWNALRRSGYFYLYVPRRFGGLEFDPDTYISATLPIAEACPSTGWTACFAAEHNWLIAQLPEATQAEVWGRTPYVIAPSVAAPPGTATPVEGGYRLSGRWKWGTVVMHADWVLLNALEAREGAPPIVRMMLLPADQVRVIDTWHMAGMAATGSNDIVAEDVFVPAGYQFAVQPVRSGRGNGRALYGPGLYGSPMLPNLCVTASIPALGAARQAIALCGERLKNHVKMGSGNASVEKPAAQMRLARADLLARSAERTIRWAAKENLAIGEIDEPEQTTERIRLRAEIAIAVQQCVEAVRTCCEAVGSSVHALDNPMQRLLRDVQVMQSHIVYDLDVATELHGRALVGLPPNSLLL
ncbi:acyl-CoA dehydrogenase family protein [Sphingopyxis granuli]|uniref:Acyl-CoA dehydrogenase domain-containing protein n=1 Tax=Sphingopyxis granuli TaxID=267128 RepID=A0AA86GHP4_9SPHN|nr:acyl-CoA dehydrogenase family protein [Sphingopyxis granuli]AMG72631.1 Acyl-CoA dehydrogenase domain-containing protein [Sphingopyxis granuli]